MNRCHLAALLLAPALALTACGGDGAEPAASAPPNTGTPSTAPSGGGDAPTGGSNTAPKPPSSAPSKVVNAFVACMREQGVKVPEDPSTWQPDPQNGRTQKALVTCMKSAGAPSS